MIPLSGDEGMKLKASVDAPAMSDEDFNNNLNSIARDLGGIGI